jgi:hypothetical protein
MMLNLAWRHSVRVTASVLPDSGLYDTKGGAWLAPDDMKRINGFG